MFKVLAVAGVVTALVVGSPAVAAVQSASPPRQAETSVTPEARALASRVFQLTTPDLEKKVTSYLREVLLEADLASLDPEVAVWFDKNAAAILMPHLRSLISDMEILYAERLTQAELQALVDFYDNPTGRSIAGKLLDLEMQMEEPVNRMAEEYMVELMTRFCATHDCGKGSNTSAKPAGR